MKWVLRVVAVLVAVPLLLYLVQAAVRTVELGQARERAAAELADGLPDAERAAEARLSRALDTLDAGTPRHHWRELTCGLESIDAGWIVQSYEQRCVVRAVALVPVSGPPVAGCEPLDVIGAGDDLPGWTVASRGAADDLTADEGWRRGCLVDPLGPPPGGETRVLEGRRPDSLAGSSTWVVARSEVEASATDLGCSPWGLVFCSAPPGGMDLGGVVG